MNNLAQAPGATWQIALSAVGGIAAVAWAYHFNHKGKVWLFLGGAIVGGSIGYLIDNA